MGFSIKSLEKILFDEFEIILISLISSILLSIEVSIKSFEKLDF